MSTKPEKLSQASKYRHFALVTLVSARFPIDNLRYDRAIPWKETDARLVEHSHERFSAPFSGQIIIITDSPDAKPHWNEDRWRQGGVSLNLISAEEAYDLDRHRDEELPRLKLAHALTTRPEDITPLEFLQCLADLFPNASDQQHIAVETTQHNSIHKDGKAHLNVIDHQVRINAVHTGATFERDYLVSKSAFKNPVTTFKTFRDCLAAIVKELKEPQ